ncbi:MAG: phosphoribosylglycinamide formyltransferase [Firmicutes bacterium]|nr:phosphoribosylglycinamide formyltransferase [Bacillota bacterium]
MIKEKNIAVLVSGGGTNLQALIDAVNDGRIKNGRISLVLSSNPDAYALTRARKNNIPVLVVPRSDYDCRASFTEAIVNALSEYNTDLIVLAGFMYILDSSFVKKYENRIMNVHPALIPSFCGEGMYGLRPHKAALERGVKITGATVHFVNEVADGGRIILQKAVAVEEGDTPETLQKRVMEQAEWEILPEAVNLFCCDKL